MANRIKVLPEDLVNKIAAGEVIERPASVVKELVENSIDAGARRIIVEIESGGRKLIRVSDDGMGMSEDDAILAFERHSTSKIASVEDLVTIHTLGFRGEALASIAAVSQLEMITRTKGSMSGSQIKINGGVLKDVTAHPSPIGTTISVKRLFFNTPARYKFLKTISTEMTHIINVVTQQGIANPQIAFKLTHNGRASLDLPTASDLQARLRDVFGKESSENLVEINLENKNIKIYGYVGKPRIARKDKRFQYIYVNGRHINNRTISHAIYESLKGALPKDRHPVLAIFLEINPSFLDVNVHPTKAEVRFSNNQIIYKSVLEALGKAFSFQDKISDFYSEETVSTKKYNLHTPPKKETQTNQQPQFPYYRKSAPPSRKQISAYENILKKDYQIKVDESSIESRDKNFSIIGQAHNCYILLETSDGIMLIDQHVAHERILYEKAKRALRENPLASQKLLFPITLDLNPVEFSFLGDNKRVLEKLGFHIKSFSGRTVVIEMIPAALKNWEDGKALKDILNENSEDVSEIIDDEEKIIVNFSCKSAVKKGQRLSFEEMASLIRDWLKTDTPYTCPHGRPIALNLTLQELDRKFGRS